MGGASVSNLLYVIAAFPVPVPGALKPQIEGDSEQGDCKYRVVEEVVRDARRDNRFLEERGCDGQHNADVKARLSGNVRPP